MSGVFDRLFGGKNRVMRRIVIDGEVLDDMLGAATSCYPKEFGALLEGSFETDTLEITGYILPHSLSGRDNVLMNIGMIPSTTETIGSIHSHPASGAVPSAADLHFFQKRGLVHFIMANPYVRNKVRAYDRLGRSIRFSIR